MKKTVTLAAAGCMVLAYLATASAVTMKVGGQWYFHYGYYSNNMLVANKDSGKHADRLRARQRIRTQFQFITDKNLTAMVNLEANLFWGQSSDSLNGGGAAIDADQSTFVIKHAFLDWTHPGTRTKLRMGMQGIDMPMATFGNPVMEADVAGVALSLPSSRELGMTAFWARPFDRSYGAEDQIGGKNSLDDMDLFGIMFPIKSDAVRATSWGMFAFIGKDSDFYTNARNFNRGNRSIDTGAIDGATRAWWLGMALELPALDPFFVKLDAMAGALDTGVDDYNTLGWMISGDIGYDFSWGKLSALGWYSSGDDDTNDRGQIPIISDDGGFRPTRYGTGGTSARSFDRVLTSTGRGLWGLGLKLATVSFVDNLNHTFIAMYMGGTNKKDALTQNRSTGDSAYDARFARDQLATSDRAWEIDWLNTYKVRDNLTIQLDFACVWLDLGDTWANKNDTEGSFATMIGFTYSF